MRQRLGQGCAEDGHGCNPQMQWFDVLTLLEMNGIRELELYSTGSSSSVSRRVWLLACPCSKPLWWKLEMSSAPQDLGMRWRRFQVGFMLACRPYGRLNPFPFWRLMAPAGQSELGCWRFCGGFRSHLYFHDWTDLQRCRFSRQEGCESLLSRATAKDPRKCCDRSKLSQKT
jgi:hypothetical protein